MSLISALFVLLGATVRPTFTTAFPVDLVANVWAPSSFIVGGGGGGEIIGNLYDRADTNNVENLRTISNIVWSCLATVFACSWLSVHPNIPSPKDSDFSIVRRRIGLMFWAIIAPELLIIWAMRQWIHARKIARQFKSRGWTNVHGHFLVMGGFMLCDEGGKPIQTLSIEQFKELLKDKSIDFPLISKKEILDRSKGDLLSKSIIIIQVAWFAVQCMARRSQGLAITELELVTVAFTTLNGAMYYFWWDKPLDVQSTVRVHLKKPFSTTVEKTPNQDKLESEELDIAENPNQEFEDGVSKDTASEAVHQHKYEPLEIDDVPLVERDDEDERDRLPLKTRIWMSIIETIHSLGKAIIQPFVEIACYVEKRGIIGSIWRIFVYLPIKNILFGFGNIVESDTSQTVASGALRVPMFYAPQIGLDGTDITRLVASGLGIIFGSIHLAAWSGEFPTHGAQTAWRVASLIVTLLPAVIFVAKSLAKFSATLGDSWEDFCEVPLFVVEFLTGSMGIFVYVPSRIALFALAFYCLRSIPPSGFQKVVWTSFIPHIS